MERSLVERARAGDRDSFEALVRNSMDTVYRTAYTILGNPADAQDATQEAFIAMWRGLPGLRDLDRFDAWFGRILVNSCRMALRRRGRRVREIPVDPQLHEKVVAPDAPDGAAIAAEAFDEAFEQLPVELRALLAAHHLEGHSVSALAVATRIPEGTVKSRLHTARTALRRALEDRT